jgi:hypothetical protein
MNRELIAERCRAGGLGIHQVAMQAWVDPVVLWEDGGDHGDDRIPLGVLRRLCGILDVDLSDLADDRAWPSEEGDGEDDLADDVRVEAALAEFPDGVARDALADAFGWPLPRVERALASLKLRLEPTGRRLRWVGWHRYALGPNLAILSNAQRSMLARSAARHPVSQQEADALYQVLRGFGAVTALSKGEGAGLVESLRKRDLIRQQRAYFELSPDVVFSLRLD